jgi:hypothetical protein
MAKLANRIGAVFYLLWGLLHIVGGAALLFAAGEGGASGMLGVIDNGASPDGVDPIPAGIADGLAQFHAWNLLWLGLLVSVVALMCNWRGSRLGYWINLSIVVAADVGLIAFLVVPGYMPATDAIPGPFLAILALAFASLGMFAPSSARFDDGSNQHTSNQIIPA